MLSAVERHWLLAPQPPELLLRRRGPRLRRPVRAGRGLGGGAGAGGASGDRGASDCGVGLGGGAGHERADGCRGSQDGTDRIDDDAGDVEQWHDPGWRGWRRRRLSPGRCGGLRSGVQRVEAYMDRRENVQVLPSVGGVGRVAAPRTRVLLLHRTSGVRPERGRRQRVGLHVDDGLPGHRGGRGFAGDRVLGPQPAQRCDHV
mmetsp:Transcript_91424/g.263215  ORF Transcript_91424/g.263215 Transcript_91424/m.263215 type:complete len:202 (+) Transcript_91424:99-704(+)